MFRFLFGAAVACGTYYVLSNHPEWIHQAVDVGRQQLAVATRNLKVAVKGEDGSRGDDSEDQSTAINFTRVEKLSPSMERTPTERLWRAMNEDDFDRRAAAGQILLRRAGIPISADGVDVVRRQYLQSPYLEEVMTGFNYLGLLALQDVPEDSIVRLVQGYVERRPRSQACDHALWALGQLGSEEMVPYFFKIIEHEQTYGPAARERAFCSLVQCGRYSSGRRLELMPKFMQVYERAREPRTRTWAMQALGHCAPRARCRSIEEWHTWWSEQDGMASRVGGVRDRRPRMGDRG